MLKIDQQGTIPIYTTLFHCPYIGIVLQTHRAILKVTQSSDNSLTADRASVYM